MARASLEMDLPQEVRLGADESRGRPLRGEVLGPLEVQFVREDAHGEAADQVLDGQGQGEQQLVGLIVSPGQTPGSGWWDSQGGCFPPRRKLHGEAGAQPWPKRT